MGERRQATLSEARKFQSHTDTSQENPSGETAPKVLTADEHFSKAQEMYEQWGAKDSKLEQYQLAWQTGSEFAMALIKVVDPGYEGFGAEMKKTFSPLFFHRDVELRFPTAERRAIE